MVLLSYDTKPNGKDEEAHFWLVTGKVGTPEMNFDDRHDVAWFVLVGTHGNAGKLLMGLRATPRGRRIQCRFHKQDNWRTEL